MRRPRAERSLTGRRDRDLVLVNVEPVVLSGRFEKETSQRGTEEFLGGGSFALRTSRRPSRIRRASTDACRVTTLIADRVQPQEMFGATRSASAKCAAARKAETP